MSVYHLSLLGAALLAGLVSFNTPRALLWIFALAVSFVVSVSFAYTSRFYQWNFPHMGITMLCDISVLIAIQEYGKQRWETRILASLVSFSALTSLYYSTWAVFPQIWGLVPLLPTPTPLFYAIILEAINYFALLLIGGVGILNHIGASHGRNFPNGALRHILSVRNFLQRESRTQALTKW